MVYNHLNNNIGLARFEPKHQLQKILYSKSCGVERKQLTNIINGQIESWCFSLLAKQQIITLKMICRWILTMTIISISVTLFLSVTLMLFYKLNNTIIWCWCIFCWCNQRNWFRHIGIGGFIDIKMCKKYYIWKKSKFSSLGWNHPSLSLYRERRRTETTTKHTVAAPSFLHSTRTKHYIINTL